MYNFKAVVVDWPACNPPIEGLCDGMEVQCHSNVKGDLVVRVDVGDGQVLITESHLKPIEGTEWVG